MGRLVAQRSEYDSTTGNTSVVTFACDDRHRLISESRTVDNPYSLSYTYDELGNREKEPKSGRKKGPGTFNDPPPPARSATATSAAEWRAKLPTTQPAHPAPP